MAVGKKEATLNDIAGILTDMSTSLDKINEKLDVIVSNVAGQASSEDMQRILKTQRERSSRD